MTGPSTVERIDLARTDRGVRPGIDAHGARRGVGAALIASDLLLMAGTLGWTLPWERIALSPLWMGATAVLAALPLLAIYCLGGYRVEAIAVQGRPRHMAAAALAGTFTALVAYKALLVWPVGESETVRFTVRTLGAPLCLALWVLTSRWLARRLLQRWTASARVLCLAGPELVQRLQRILDDGRMQVPLVAIDPADAQAASQIDDALRGRVRAVVVDAPGAAMPRPLLEALVHARIARVPVLGPAQLVEELLERSPVALGDPAWMVASRRLDGGSPFFLGSKRLLDLAVAIPMFALLLPVMLLTAVAVKLSSRGPVLFTQRREGLYKRPFTILKFRTMRTDAEAAGAQWATKNDPRVTPIGAFLRKSRLDEFPQLLNVILGDMSLVGPRPERPEFNGMLAARIPWYDLRHLSKPGLTGWAQVRYPYGASVEDAIAKLEFEIYYLKRASLRFDLRILLRTVAVVVGLRGR